jgi:type IV pilus assembly protein PilV
MHPRLDEMVMAMPNQLQRGISLIEVLVTLVIIAFGLLGMAGLQVRLQSSEMESYQTTQALLLLDDMRGRMEANRLQAANYADATPVATPVGAGVTCPTVTAASTRMEKDVQEWCLALQGAGESSGGVKVGAMAGGRGCVEDLGTGPAGDKLFRVTVAWQGMIPVSSPALGCGLGQYSDTGNCANDLCRRVVSTNVRMANLK